MHSPNQLIYTLDQIDRPIEKIRSLFHQCQIFTFTGILGAGKTTLISQLLRTCGVTETIVSPTFTYMAQYTNSGGQTFYHFDLYRFKTLQDFMEAGFDEYLFQPNSWVFIEWPEIIMPLLDKKSCFIELDYRDEQSRVMKYSFSKDIDY